MEERQFFKNKHSMLSPILGLLKGPQVAHVASLGFPFLGIGAYEPSMPHRGLGVHGERTIGGVLTP